MRTQKAAASAKASEQMRFHPLASNVKCAACGAGLTFLRVRGYGDLYSCASGGPCRCQIMHYRHPETKICGVAPVVSTGAFFGKWTACEQEPAAKAE
jgi:hypothetical protein